MHDDMLTISRHDLRKLADYASDVYGMWGDDEVMVRTWEILEVETCELGYPIRHPATEPMRLNGTNDIGVVSAGILKAAPGPNRAQRRAAKFKK